MEVLSFAGYVALLRAGFGRVVGWRDSFFITMAGVAATRLLATAGAGGVAMTSWALHRLGLPARDVGRGMVAFLVTLYAAYLATLLVLGVGLGTGVLAGGRQPLLTLLPAALAAGVATLALAMARAPGQAERLLTAVAARTGVLRRPLRWLGGILADAGEGVRLALRIVRRRPATLAGRVAGSPVMTSATEEPSCDTSS